MPCRCPGGLSRPSPGGAGLWLARAALITDRASATRNQASADSNRSDSSHMTLVQIVIPLWSRPPVREQTVPVQHTVCLHQATPEQGPQGADQDCTTAGFVGHATTSVVIDQNRTRIWTSGPWSTVGLFACSGFIGPLDLVLSV